MLHDFADKDFLQWVNFVRFLYGQVIPPCRDVR